MAKSGAHLVLLARSQEKLLHLKKQIPTEGEVIILAQDMSHTQGLKIKVKELLEEIGPIEIMVHNAGGPKAGTLLEAETDEFVHAFATHVLSAHTLAQLLVPGMKEKGYGRVINVISTSVKIPIPFLGVSNTIRGAMANWAKSLANEVGEYNITVNNVLPGFTATERLDAIKSGAAQRLGKSLEEVEEMWLDCIPLRRFAQPQETAQAIAYLASPAAAYINGINLPVDGGRTGCL